MHNLAVASLVSLAVGMLLLLFGYVQSEYFGLWAYILGTMSLTASFLCALIVVVLVVGE